MSISGRYAEQTPQRWSLLRVRGHYRFQVFLKSLLRIDEKPGHIFVGLLHFVHLALVVDLDRVLVAIIHRLNQELVRSGAALLRLRLHWGEGLTLHFFDHPLSDVGATCFFSVRLHCSDRAIKCIFANAVLRVCSVEQ